MKFYIHCIWNLVYIITAFSLVKKGKILWSRWEYWISNAISKRFWASLCDTGILLFNEHFICHHDKEAARNGWKWAHFPVSHHLHGSFNILRGLCNYIPTTAYSFSAAAAQCGQIIFYSYALSFYRSKMILDRPNCFERVQIVSVRSKLFWSDLYHFGHWSSSN